MHSVRENSRDAGSLLGSSYVGPRYPEDVIKNLSLHFCGSAFLYVDSGKLPPLIIAKPKKSPFRMCDSGVKTWS